MNCRCSVVAEVCREFREQKTNKQTNKKIQQKTNHIQHQGRGRGRGSSQQIFLYGTAPTPFQSRSHLFESIIIKMYDGDFFFQKINIKVGSFRYCNPAPTMEQDVLFSWGFFWSRFWISLPPSPVTSTHIHTQSTERDDINLHFYSFC